MLRSKTLPGSSLRARSLTAPPHPTLPPIPAARDLARRLDPPPFPHSLPFLPSSHPVALYLSTYPPLPIYLSIYRPTSLPTHLPIYLPPSRLTPSPCPPPGPPLGRPRARVSTSASLTLSKAGLFSSLSSPQALPDPSRAVFFFFLFYANQAGLEPDTSLFAN